MNVDAVVVYRSSGADPLTRIGGVPLLVRAVESLLGAGGLSRVHVLSAQASDHTRVVDACAGLPIAVHPHALQRGSGTRSDGSNAFSVILATADAVVLHDVAWALVDCAAVLPRVLAGLAAGHVAVAPVVPLTDTVKDVDASGFVVGTPDRAGLCVVQTPQAYRSATLDRVALPDADAAPALAAAGIGVHTVTGDPSAFALRTGDDVDLARAVVRG